MIGFQGKKLTPYLGGEKLAKVCIGGTKIWPLNEAGITFYEYPQAITYNSQLVTFKYKTEGTVGTLSGTCDVEWAHVVLIDDASIQVAFEENMGVDSRFVTVALTDGNVSAHAAVVQGCLASIVIDKSVTSVTSSEQSITVPFVAKGELGTLYAISDDTDIATIAIDDRDSFTATFSKNTGDDPRSVTFTITDRTYSDSITITQAANLSINVIPSATTVNGDGGIVELTLVARGVTSKNDVEIVLDEVVTAYTIDDDFKASVSILDNREATEQTHDIVARIKSDHSVSGKCKVTQAVKEGFRLQADSTATFAASDELYGASNGTMEIALEKVGEPNDVELKVSVDYGAWTDYTFGTVLTASTVLFKNKDEEGTLFSKYLDTDYYHFTSSSASTFTADGDITYLISKNKTDEYLANCFCSLFKDSYISHFNSTLEGTKIEGNAFNAMFEGCGYLVSGPSAIGSEDCEIGERCCMNMFYGCESLAVAPSLPATTLATSCYQHMFRGCTSLTVAPSLSATALAVRCYCYMFYYCTSLTEAPELPATTLVSSCYDSMFNNCRSLAVAPELPATTLISRCYFNMFGNCTSLTETPSLPATTLATNCYDMMFYACTSLTVAPELPATTLADGCYNNMFSGCTSLTTAPRIFGGDGLKLQSGHCQDMFTKCPSLKYGPEKIGGDNSVFGNDSLRTVFSGHPWVSFPAAIGGKNTIFGAYACANMFSGCTNLVTGPSSIGGEGTVMSGNYNCLNMFYDCTSLTGAPELPATTLDTGCYNYMFYNCASLTGAPELPATALANQCYQQMFQGCTNLAEAPALPATTLAESCYQSMFSNCTSLTGAPALPAAALANSCYRAMFQGCTNLDEAPELSATTLTDSCYLGMFSGCTSLTVAPELPATALASSCYNGMFQYCTNLVTAPRIFGGDGLNLTSDHCQSMFDSCPNLKYGPEKIGGDNSVFGERSLTTAFSGHPWVSFPAAIGGKNTTFWTNACVNMFSGCTSLVTGPSSIGGEGTVMNGSGNCMNMFYHCLSLTVAPELPATTLASNCYYGMFQWCSNLEYAPRVFGGDGLNLQSGYCQDMFDRCDRLKYGPEKIGGNNSVFGDGVLQSIFGNHPWVSFPAAIGGKNTTFQRNSCTAMFYGCTTLVTGPSSIGGEGTVMSGSGNCTSMFYGCTSLTGAPALPATTLTSKCYEGMFDGCKSLTVAPELPATALAEECYAYMFSGCTSLVIGPSSIGDEGTVMSGSGNCQSMFAGCTSLTGAPELPATTLTSKCYQHMFSYCTSLTEAPALSAMTLANSCYWSMFEGCTSLTGAPELPATRLVPYCYNAMFSGCTSLTEAPALSATALVQHCYPSMFEGCTSLTGAPELPATTLADYCYEYMFAKCTSLTEAPALPATALTWYCYSRMFSGCTSLSAITCMAKSLDMGRGTLTQWVQGVSPTGSFTMASDMHGWTVDSVNGIPIGWTSISGLPTSKVNLASDGGTYTYQLTKSSIPSWTDVEITITGDLNFTEQPSISNTGVLSFKTGPNTSSVKKSGIITLTYKYGTSITVSCNFEQNIADAKDGLTFEVEALGTETTSIQLNKEGTDTSVSLRYSVNDGAWENLVFGEPITLNEVGDKVIIASTKAGTTFSIGNTYYQFVMSAGSKFKASNSISYLVHSGGTESAVNDNEYQRLFKECSGLTTAPELPIVTNRFGENCFYYMFSNCTNLVTAPTIAAASTYASGCCHGMFSGCTKLENAPSFLGNADSLVRDNAFAFMFSGCKNLKTMPSLPSTHLFASCYNGMFSGCSKLDTVQALPATTLASNCYEYMFQGCSALKSFSTLPATTLANACYKGMFSGCTSLTGAPALPATALTSECYKYMFSKCSALKNAPVLSAATVSVSAYTQMFSSCSSLTAITCLATDISAADCTSKWVSGVSSIGEFTKAPSMTAWTVDNVNGIPNGWTQLKIHNVTSDVNIVNIANIANSGQSGYSYQLVKKSISSWDDIEITTSGDIVYAEEPSISDSGVITFSVSATTSAEDVTGAIVLTYKYGTSITSRFNLTQSSVKYGLTFTALKSGSKVKLSKLGTPYTGVTIEYSVNGGEWSGYTIGSGSTDDGSGTIVDLESGDTVTLRSTHTGTPAQRFSKDALNTYTFYMSGKIKASGNVCYLLDKDANVASIPDYGFCELFGWGYSQCLSDVSELTMPNVSLGKCSMWYMFENTNITSAPALPATELGISCYSDMFKSCTKLVTPPALPATTLTEGCYDSMFYGCTSLSGTPLLAAKIVPESAYKYMFYDCSRLTYAPQMAATSITASGCSYMFNGCTSLVTAPPLGNITQLEDGACDGMFYGCTMLSSIPTLPDVTIIPTQAYKDMFNGCISMSGTTSSFTKITSLGTECFMNMFANCLSLTTVSQLPNKVDTLPERCYASMYKNCSKLTVVGSRNMIVISASTAGKESCMEMFAGCPNVGRIQSTFGSTCAFNLTFTTLGEGSCYGMFSGVTNMLEAPALSAETVPASAYAYMFADCVNLSAITCNATDITAQDSTLGWAHNVASHGNFVRATGMSGWTADSEDGIPEGWLYFRCSTSEINAESNGWYSETVEFDYSSLSSEDIEITTTGSIVYQLGPALNTDMSFVCGISGNTSTAETLNGTIVLKYKYATNLSVTINVTQAKADEKPGLCFTSLANGNTLSLTMIKDPSSTRTINNLQYSKNNGEWQNVMFNNSKFSITGLSSGNTVVFRRDTDSLEPFSTEDLTLTFGMTNSFEASNSLVYLVKRDGKMKTTDEIGDHCFNSIFSGCTGLKKAPTLPTRNIGEYTFRYAFAGCTSLTSAPMLQPTVMAKGCYEGMFMGCTSLATMPFLKSTSLAVDCYKNMFNGCTSLSNLRDLPANILAEGCYESMFEECSQITSAPSLAAIALVDHCYRRMFYNASSLALITCNAASTSAENATDSWVFGVAPDGRFQRNESNTFLDVNSVNGVPEGWTYIRTDENYFDIDCEAQVITVSCTKNCIPAWYKVLVTASPSEALSETPTIDDNGVMVIKVLRNESAQSREIEITLAYSGYTDEVNTTVKILQGAASQNKGLRFTAINGNATVSLNIVGAPKQNEFEYATDFGEWQNYRLGDDISLSSASPSILFRNKTSGNTQFSTSSGNYYHFAITGTVKAEGSIEYLLSSNGKYPVATDYAFYNLFNGCTGLTTAPELPSKVVGQHAYQGMFINCTSLAKQPDLPATSLSGHCYEEMFKNCSSMTAGKLPATTVPESAYASMFQGCTTLAKMPSLNARNLGSCCYYQMFYGCTGLLAALTLGAENVPTSGYYGMFQGCTSLTKAPTLPAESLTQSCYVNMFNGCTNLAEVRVYAHKGQNNGSTNNWLYNVRSTGNFYYKVPRVIGFWSDGPSGIPEGWDKHQL